MAEVCTIRTLNGSRELTNVDLKHLFLGIAENKMAKNCKKI